MPVSRRDFLKISAGLAAAGVLAASASTLTILDKNRKESTLDEEDYSSKTTKTSQWVMLIDLDKCDGCKVEPVPICLQACAVMHYTPKRFKASGEPEEPEEPQRWIHIYEKEDNPIAGPYFLPVPCQHCDDPPCVHVCPIAGATYKTEEGLVVVDVDHCIGTRQCMAACPYNVRHFNWGDPEPMYGTKEENEEAIKRMGGYTPTFALKHVRGTVEKCDFCSHQAKAGGFPGCVGGCPTGALYYGDRNFDAVTNNENETISFTETIEERQGYYLNAEAGTKPRVVYLPKKD
ncbi:MAG: 4Fe-4S dicluster domain-containing protein [Candidatus Heimdallarchaeota archaeon]